MMDVTSLKAALPQQENGLEAGPRNAPTLDSAVIPLLVVGAGPHALALVSKLLERSCDPLEEAPHNEVLFDRRTQHLPGDAPNRPRLQPRKRFSAMSDREMRRLMSSASGNRTAQRCALTHIRVIDPAGCWMAQWEAQFSALGIPHLRSGVTAHCDPIHMQALDHYAIETGQRMEGVVPLVGLRRGDGYEGPYDAPTRKLFGEFCESVVARYSLGSTVQAGRVTAVRPYWLPVANKKESVMATATAVEKVPREQQRLAAADVKSCAVDTETDMQTTDAVPSSTASSSNGSSSSSSSSSSSNSGGGGPTAPNERPTSSSEEHGGGGGGDDGGGRGGGTTAVTSDGPASMTHSPVQRPHAFEVTLDNGSTLHAQSVVMAHGPLNQPVEPDFFGCLDAEEALAASNAGTLLHATQLLFAGSTGIAVGERVAALRGRRLLIVGGGLTAGHLAARVLREADGVTVTLASRRSLRIRQYDLDLPWMGRLRHHRLARDFWPLDAVSREEMLRSTKDGGSITPEIRCELQKHEAEGRLELLENTEGITINWESDVSAMTGSRTTDNLERIRSDTCAADSAARNPAADAAAAFDATTKKGEGAGAASAAAQSEQRGNGAPTPSLFALGTGKWCVSFDTGDTAHYAAIWAATGTRIDVRRDTLLRETLNFAESQPDLVVPELLGAGRPAVTPDLRLVSGLNLFVTGEFAGLELGPGAVNLMGARAGAARIARALRQIDPRLSITKPSSSRSSSSSSGKLDRKGKGGKGKSKRR